MPNKKENNSLINNEEDYKIILDEKPYDLETAIYYCNKLSFKYKIIYCVIKSKRNKKRKKCYDIVSYNYYLQNNNNFLLEYITKHTKLC